MQQTSATCDYRYIDFQIPASTKAFIPYLLVVFIVSCVKLVKIWIPATPFRLSARADSPAYVEILENSSASLDRWMHKVCS
jgi:hypothetical protein